MLIKTLLKIQGKIKSTNFYIFYIYLYIFIMPWNFVKWQMGVFSIVLFIWWIYKFKYTIFEKLKKIYEFKPLVVLLLFILFTYIASLWSDSITDGFKHVNKFHKYYLLIIPVLFTSLSLKEAETALKVFLFSFAIYSIFSLTIFFGLISIVETGSNSANPKGILAYAISSIYMAIGVGSSLYFIYNSKEKRTKLLFIAIVLLCLFALFINQSRTAQLSFFLTIVTIAIFYGYRHILNWKFLLSGLFIIISIIYIFNATGKYKRFVNAYLEAEQVFVDNTYKGSFGVRMYFYVAGYEVIKDNFFFGIGPEDNIQALSNIQRTDDNYTSRKIYMSYHSQHLDTFTRYGFVGYLLLIASVLFLLYKLKKNRLYYFYGLSFFLITFYASFANV
ncbi:MAG: O-antigen ligase family protein, partial [Sulfurimonas sp.]|nr:O-antigen ligase family protein [Sulfurimonas sp.]